MKILTKHNFIQKLTIAIVCMLLLNFCFAPKSMAFGGKMMGYIREFSTAIADTMGSLIQFGVTGKWIGATYGKNTGLPSGSDYWITKNFEYPVLQISPELIFANKIQLLDVNFISPIKDAGNYILKLEDEGPLKVLRDIVAGWYITLRTIAIVGLLSVLIYVGIRIIIASTSGEKAKYKQKLMDWVVAFCLLFFMHYIMAATITVVEKVNTMLGATLNLDEGLELNPDYGTVVFYPDLEQNENNESISQTTVGSWRNEDKYRISRCT